MKATRAERNRSVADRLHEAVARSIGPGQAALCRDLATIAMAQPPDEDRAPLGALVLAALCGDFDPLRCEGDATEALRAAIEASGVTPWARMLLGSVLHDHQRGLYRSEVDVDRWAERVVHANAPRVQVKRVGRRRVARPPHRWRMTPRLERVLGAARDILADGKAVTFRRLGHRLKQRPTDVAEAVSSLVAMGALVEIGPARELDLGEDHGAH